MKPDKMKELQLPEGFRKLLKRLRRGGIIFYSLYLVFCGLAGGAFFAGIILHAWGFWVLAIFLFFLSLACRLTVLVSIGRKHISAWKAAENPQIIYWAHSLDGQGRATDKIVTESRNVRFHLKDGTQFEVEAVLGTGTSQEELREVISWFRQRNSSIRWGNYDKPCF
jgi:hypothetical protein